jgi:hypothetical protein
MDVLNAELILDSVALESQMGVQMCALLLVVMAYVQEPRNVMMPILFQVPQALC